MGYAAAGSCWSSIGSAAASACGSLSGVYGAGVLQCTGVTSTSGTGAVFSMTRFNDSGIPTVYSQAMDLPACEAFTVADGIELGWIVGGIWIAGWAILWIKRAL